MKFYIYNAGTCIRVKLFGEDVRNLLKLNGWNECSVAAIADYLIINTCSFLESKSSYFLEFIQIIEKQRLPFQKIVVIGCLGGTHEKEILAISKDILIFKRDLDVIACSFKCDQMPKATATNISETLPLSKMILEKFNRCFLHSKHIEFRLKREHVCYIQMSTGCLGKCTYCSEKFITKLKSRPIKEILDAVDDGIKRGFTLFSLSSDDASAYGKDIASSLDELLMELCKIKQNIYFIIPEFNPQGLSESVIKSLSDKKFLYITIPIQSGSQKILNKMKRPYEIDKVVKDVCRIKNSNKHLMVNTHVIVGFPGETDEDFEKTRMLLKTGLFDRVKVFMYSERPGTKAALFPDKVSQTIKENRRQKILKTMRHSNLKKMSLTNLILNLEQIKE